jgi:hypothetical protein
MDIRLQEVSFSLPGGALRRCSYDWLGRKHVGPSAGVFYVEVGLSLDGLDSFKADLFKTASDDIRQKKLEIHGDFLAKKLL